MFAVRSVPADHKHMMRRSLTLVGVVVMGMCVRLAAGVRLHGGLSVAGNEMPQRAQMIATGWSVGQSSVSTLRRMGTNSWYNAGQWQTYLLVREPLAPVITGPVMVAGGGTGYVEVVETHVVVVGLKPPLAACPFLSLTYADDPSIIKQEESSPEWRQELELTPGMVYTVTYVTSNRFARSRDATALRIDVVPESSAVVMAVVWALAVMRRRASRVMVLLCGLLWGMRAAAAPIMMNYQGIIEMDGGAYHGPGYFKLAIRDAGGRNVWANDGTPAGEPVVSVYCSITNGSFRLVIGGYEMMPLQDNIFYTNTNLRLYIWFGRSSHGPFELLADGEPLYTVPYAANARAVGDITPGAIVTTQSLAVVSNQFAGDLSRYLTAVAATNTFLLKTGDTCSGQLRVSNLVVDTDVEITGGDVLLGDGGRVYFNAAGTAYVATGTNGALTIYSHGEPALEFE